MRPRTIITLVVASVALSIAAAIGAYVKTLGHLRFSTNDPGPWGEFGDYIGGILNPLFALINAAAVIYVGFTINRLESEREKEAARRQQLDERERKAAERRKNTVQLIDRFQNLQFYKEVSAPVWEIFVKWRHWKGPDGTQYRFSVVTGFVHYQQLDFQSEAERSPFGHNFVRFVDHYHPADYVPPKLRSRREPAYIQSVLSEHQALTCWLEYWGNVHTMIDAELVDEEILRRALSDWYGYWLELVAELRFIVETLYHEKRSSNASIDSIHEPLPNWIEETKAIERCFFSGAPNNWYKLIMDVCDSRAKLIFEEINPLISERINVNNKNDASR
jgi:hypothetical protein